MESPNSSRSLLGQKYHRNQHKLIFLFGLFAIQAVVFTSYVTSNLNCVHSDISSRNYIDAPQPNNADASVSIATLGNESTTTNDPAVITTASASSLAKDKRLQVDRPFMDSVANSMMNSIREIEKVHSATDACNNWGGSKFMNALIKSSKELVNGGSSSVATLKNDNVQIFYARNVSVSFEMSEQFATKKHPKPKLTLGVDGDFSLPKVGKGGTVLEQMVSKRINLHEECSGHYIDYPVMLVDSNLDSWNWWFFLQTILHQYVVVAALQPQIMGSYDQESMRILHTIDDQWYLRSNLDAFDMLFSDHRSRDSRQLWFANDIMKENKQQLCFRQVFWAPSFPAGGRLLVNRKHKNDSCFSSIVYSYAAYMKAAMHILTLPRPSKPRVIWVGRDMSSEANWNAWQRKRMIDNQPKVIEYLKKKCKDLGIELIVADFYGAKKEMPIQEQALFVSKANIMIGIHGAGLNMFHFMPFNSVVIEIHKGTNANQNSRNYVKMISDGAYFTTDGGSGKQLNEAKMWDKLKQGIDKWNELNGVSKE